MEFAGDQENEQELCWFAVDVLIAHRGAKRGDENKVFVRAKNAFDAWERVSKRGGIKRNQGINVRELSSHEASALDEVLKEIGVTHFGRSGIFDIQEDPKLPPRDSLMELIRKKIESS